MKVAQARSLTCRNLSQQRRPNLARPAAWSGSKLRLRQPLAVACRACEAGSARRQMVSGLLSAAAGLSLLWPGNGMAMEAAAGPHQHQDQVAVAAEVAPAAAVEQQEAASCYLVASDLSEAPDLAADGEASQGCAGTHSLEATLVNGLGWVVEEAQEVTNFTENNFAAVGAPSTSMWLSNSPWCLMWDAYCNVLTTRPVATKLATGMVGTFLGDMVAQATQGLLGATSSSSRSRGSTAAGSSTAHVSAASGARQGFELDLQRTGRLVGFSALVGTPVAFVWFSLLDQYVFPADPTSPLAVFSKVALDQVCMAPLMTSVFFATMTFLEGCRSRQQVVSTVQSKLKPTLLANWTVWPLAHVINFALVPPAQRILYINVVNIAWTAFMSHMANSGASQADEQQQQQQQQQQQRSVQPRKQLQQASR